MQEQKLNTPNNSFQVNYVLPEPEEDNCTTGTWKYLNNESTLDEAKEIDRLPHNCRPS